MLQLTVNGRAETLAQETPLPEFLAARGIVAKNIAVARNGEVIERDHYPDIVLRSGDVIEIVRMVGGG